ncbi:MAG: nuclear transport factor 2 family protein [Chloroflexota bacterium]|nr:nuclear transport factor 2 family protein [Chloroflexota bacterium]
MTTASPVEVVQIWHDALNEGNVDRLLDHVTDDVEVVGPRGASRGAAVIREWAGRAGMQLVPVQWFARGDQVVVEAEAAWTDARTGVVSEPVLAATAFRVVDDRIVRLARYDDVGTALNAAGLAESDMLLIEGAPSS